MWTWFSQIKSDPATGGVALPLPSLFERVVGEEAGYHDGPDDDIINYHSMGKKPDEVKLYPDDQKRLVAP